MQVEEVQMKEFIKFIKELYKQDRYFKDNKVGLLPIVCGEASIFYKKSIQKRMAVKDKGRTLCQAVLIQHEASKEEMSVAFFEALPNQQEAVNLLVAEAEKFALQYGAIKIVFGLEGHCNNALGFGEKTSSYPSFGESYSKEYYHEYFAGFTQYKFVSFYDSVGNASAQIQKDLELLKGRLKDIRFEHADFSNLGFEDTMKRYTDLNNDIFQTHRFYYKREYQEDLQLFDAMRPLLKNENLIFATKGRRDIGFILWYPDFNQLVSKGKGAGMVTYIKYKIFRIYPKSAKVAEFGLVKDCRNTGVILKLLDLSLTVVRTKYKRMDKILSSWISDENIPSKGTSKRYIKKPYKDSFVYEKNI